jgi:hypothetical protein
MSLPNSYCAKTEKVTLRKVSDLTYEAILPKYGQYLYNLMLVSNPLILDRDLTQCLIFLSFSQVKTVSLCIDGVEAVVLHNPNVANLTVNLLDLRSQYTAAIDFFRGGPIITEALYKVTPSIRVQFHSEPTVLPLLQYEVHLVDKSWITALQSTPIYANTNSGPCMYDGGALWTS